MKFRKNENRYALLFVMLLVVLFTIMGMGLYSINMNAANQFNTKEKQVGARHQAEMGIMHYKVEIAEIIRLNPRNYYLSCTDLTKDVSALSQYNNSGYAVKKEDIQCSSTNGDFTVYVLSTGRYQDREDKIKAKLYVKNMRGNKLNPGEIPKPIDYTDTVRFFDNNGIFGNGLYTQPEKSLHVTGYITNEKGNSSGGNNILIERNLYIDKDIDFTNHACIVTRGDLVVRGVITSTNKAYIFVYGDAYFDQYTYTSKNNMIYVSGDVYVNGFKKTPKNFQSVPAGTSSNGCALPGSGNPGTLTPIWNFNSEVEVDYFIN